MKDEEYQLVAPALSEDQSEENIQRLAALLVQYRAEEELRVIVNQINEGRQVNEHVRTLRYYPFLSPPKQVTLQTDAYGNEIITQPQSQRYKVRVVDLPAFAKEMGLSVEGLRDLGEGKIREYKGWRREPYRSNMLEQGRHYTEPRTDDEVAPPKKPRKQEVYQMLQPTIE